jgi:hypothetical protein
LLPAVPTDALMAVAVRLSSQSNAAGHGENLLIHLHILCPLSHTDPCKPSCMHACMNHQWRCDC